MINDLRTLALSHKVLFKIIWPGNRNHDSPRHFENPFWEAHPFQTPLITNIIQLFWVLSVVILPSQTWQCSNLALDILTALDWAFMKGNAFEWLCFFSQIPGPWRTGLHLRVGFWERRPWEGQLQLWRLHQQHLHAVDQQQYAERQRALVQRGLFVHPRHNLQQWRPQWETDCKSLSLSLSVRLQKISNSYPLIEEVALQI